MYAYDVYGCCRYSLGPIWDEELQGKKSAMPVVLPPGWRMEWVKRKKKEMREFVDPEQRRYRSVREA